MSTTDGREIITRRCQASWLLVLDTKEHSWVCVCGVGGGMTAYHSYNPASFHQLDPLVASISWICWYLLLSNGSTNMYTLLLDLTSVYSMLLNQTVFFLFPSIGSTSIIPSCSTQIYALLWKMPPPQVKLIKPILLNNYKVLSQHTDINLSINLWVWISREALVAVK